MTDIWNKRSLYHLLSSPQAFIKTVAKKSISDTMRSQTKGPLSQLDQMLKGRNKKYNFKNILQLGFSNCVGLLLFFGGLQLVLVFLLVVVVGFFYNYTGHSNKHTPLRLSIKATFFFTIWIEHHSYSTIIAKAKIYIYSPCMTFLFLTDMVYQHPEPGLPCLRTSSLIPLFEPIYTVDSWNIF